ARLGSEDPKQRDSATKELLGLGEAAYPAVQRAARSPDAEVSRRVRDLLKALAEKAPELVTRKGYDTVVTPDFALAGRIEGAAFKARWPCFGEVQLRLAELRSLRRLGGSSESKLAIDAARYAAQQGAWLDTEVEVAAETVLEITADGTVDLWPIAP